MSRSIRTLTVVLAVLLLAVMPAMAAPPDGAERGKASSANGIYIVQMIDEPVVAYEGGVRGLKATAPAAGEKIDPKSAKVINYRAYLNSKHDAALNDVGGGRKLYDYTISYNGFAAELTETQAADLRANPNVLAVTKNEMVEMDTSSTPTFLGLTDPGGLWDQLGGVGSAGEGIIIGVVDSGIWPESLSFSDRVGKDGSVSAVGKLVYRQIPGWHGKCTPGEGFNASMCNQKLIGAQWFNASWGGDAGIEAQRPWEFTSARDYNGHGTHTSSTAGGNYGVPVTGPAAVFGAVSGMAPRARIATYKALWSTEAGDTASGYTADLVAAIDQAVADGVDVINYSISGSRTNFADPVMIAYLFAARAGIFVATSAGNSGPDVSTVAHPSPWVTTVAAGTHNRSTQGSVTLGNDSTYYGPSLAAEPVTAPLIDSTAAGLPGADATQVRLCYSSLDGGAVLDPAKVAGKIVVCDRGTTARVNKSYAVMEAGGVGMILVNTTATQSLNTDLHSVPTVHLASADRAAVKTYAATPDATATINPTNIDYSTPAPYTASFSSRGPLLAGGGDVLKPDVMAPGVDILAAVSPASGGGHDFNLYSGTSMSSPHVAGLAALLKDLHPAWTPMMVKSALMTTGYDILDGPNTDPAVIFSQGAGHVKPNSAANPGLVFNAGWNDWLAFLCGTTPGVVNPASCDALVSRGYPTDPSDMNVASIAIGDLAGMQTVTRKVTNVGGSAATYTPSYTGMAGFTVDIAPASLTLAAGETKSFTVKFTRSDAALDAYTGGQLTWSDGTHTVRIPMVVQPVAMAAPAEILGSGESGSASFDVTFGYTGSYTAAAHGLVPATETTDNVPQDPDQTFDPADGYSDMHTFDLSSVAHFRLALPPEATEADADLDVYVFDPNGELVASSTNGGTDEQIDIAAPMDGTWYVFVHGWAAPGGDSPYTMYTWAISATPGGNLTIDSAPTSVTTAATKTISVSWTGATAGQWHLGAVSHTGDAGLMGLTLVNVDNR